MYPILIKIGPLPLHTFGVMLAIAILVGSSVLLKEARRLGDPQITDERLERLIWYVVLAVVGGGRLMHCIVEWRYFADHPLKILAVWEGGLVFYGGFLATFFTVVVFAARNKMRILRLCDLLAPSAFLGQVIGRWGCLVAGDDYGKPMSEAIHLLGFQFHMPAWVGITFTRADSLVPPQLRGVPLEPAQIFMSLKALIVTLILFAISRRKKFDGQVAGWSFVIYAPLRSIIEQFRGDADRGFVFAGMSTAQFTSVFALAIGVLILWTAPRRLLADDLADAEKSNTLANGAARKGKKGMGAAPPT